MAVQSFNFMMAQIQFGGKVPMLMKSTSDDETPIPGYLYDEISELSYQSPGHCEFLLEFLVKRLSKSSCHVKLKTLQLMKYLVEKGEPSFRKGLHKKSGCIQETTKFGGPAHPLYGNMPYLAVRQIAKELSGILSELNMQPSAQPQQSQRPAPVKNMGGLGPASTGTGGKYYGFGNSTQAKKSFGDTIRDGIERLADQLGETPVQRQAALMTQLEKSSSGEYVPPVIPSPPCPPINKRPQPVKKVVPKSYAPGRAGGGWDTVLDTEEDQGSGPHSEEGSESSERLEMPSADWSAEEQLVTEYLFIEDTSQFFLLRPSELKIFKKKCQDLNCEKIVDYINEKLQSTNDYVVVRAMLLLETFLFRNDAVHLDYIVTVCQKHLNHLVHTSQDQRIVDKAGKIIVILEKYSTHRNILVASDEVG